VVAETKFIIYPH